MYNRGAMRKPTLTLSILALLILSACYPPSAPPRSWGGDGGGIFDYTGEEKPLSQVRGLGQLAANVLHPSPQTASGEPIAHAGVNPFGINVFLNEEVEPEKRERSVQMIADAGFHWLRQEFPWEDIEIHGKEDFVDRRNDLDGDGEADAVDAWAKYDHIVDLSEQYGLEIVPRDPNRAQKEGPDDDRFVGAFYLAAGQGFTALRGKTEERTCGLRKRTGGLKPDALQLGKAVVHLADD